MKLVKLERKHQKIFADSAIDSQLGKIGSAAAGSPERTRDIEEMQELAQYERGYFDIVSSDGDARLPFSEDLNSLLHIPTRQLAYLMQAGVAEWDPKTHYYENSSIVQYLGELYISIAGYAGNPNVGNTPGRADSDGTNVPNNNRFWKLYVSAFPIGFDHIQFPNKPAPNELGLPGAWEDTSLELGGAFIRFAGPNASDFGAGFQSGQIQAHSHFTVVPETGGSDISPYTSIVRSRTDGRYIYTLEGSLTKPTVGKTSTAGAHETRPINVTVRKWTRIS